MGGAKGAGRVEVCWAAGVGAGEGFLERFGRVVLRIVKRALRFIWGIGRWKGCGNGDLRRCRHFHR